jgi:aminoglycoside phosphotransferase (APT) family kinase protein
VIHGDLGPWNTIWRDGQPVGLIGWDFAEPSTPLTDVAELAFFVTPMHDDDHCAECGFSTPPDRQERLRVFCDAYGCDGVEQVADAVERCWELEIERTTTFGPRGIRPWVGARPRTPVPERGRRTTT